jgi:hypothetical protein
MLLMFFLLSMPAAAVDLESRGWRRQEQNGVVAFFRGEEAMVVRLPPKAIAGTLRETYEKARESFLGGALVQRGTVQEMGGGVYSEYVVREANGSQTFRASFAQEREGQMWAALFATNDEPSFQKHRGEAMAFFGVSSPGPASAARSSPTSVVGEWYTGRLSTIQYQDRVTGAPAPASGNNMTYRFHADGTYEQFGLMQFTYATCTNSYFMNLSGRWELQGDVLRVRPAAGTFDSRTCGGQSVRKPANLVETVWKVRVNENELIVTDEKGASSTYRRK